MDLNTDEIMQEILNTDLGVDAILTTASPVRSKKIRVDFRNPYDQKNAGEIVYEGEELYADAATSDVTNVRSNDIMKIENVTYKIVEKQPDGAGLTRLILTKRS